MLKVPVTSDVFVYVPVDGPADPTGYDVSLALIPVGSGREPADGEYLAANWLAPAPGEAKEAAFLLGVDPAIYAAGEYMMWVRLVASPQDIRLKSGRVIIGDPA